MQCHVTPSKQPRLIWGGGWTNPYDGTRQQKCSTSDFNDAVSFTFVCTLVYFDHTVVLVQLDVRSRKWLNCYPLSVDLLEHTGNQVSTLEACIFNLRTQYWANPYSSRCATSLDSKICYCSSSTNHPADYFVDKTQITILDFTFQNSKFTTYWQLEITIQPLGGVADPQSVIFNMTYVFLVVGNIHAICISPHDNLLDNMKDWHVTPHDSRWNKNLSINTVVATEVFCPQLQCHLSQNSWAAGWQNNATVWQSDCSVYR